MDLHPTLQSPSDQILMVHQFHMLRLGYTLIKTWRFHHPINPTSQCTWCSSSGLRFRYFLMLPRRPGRCHGEAAMLRDNHRIWVKSKNLEEFTKMNWNLSRGWGLPYSTSFSFEVAPSVVRSFTQIQSYTQTWYTRTSSMEPKKKNMYIIYIISFPWCSNTFTDSQVLSGATFFHPISTSHVASALPWAPASAWVLAWEGPPITPFFASHFCLKIGSLSWDEKPF